MKKSLLTFLVLLVAISCFGQSWMNTGNALQRQTNGTYSNYRFNLGSPGFMYFYNKTQTDSLFNIAIVSGVTSFNGRTGAIVPLIGDYSSFYQPLENQRLSTSYGVEFNNLTLSSDVTIGDVTGYYSRITPSVMVLASTTGGVNATYNNAQIHFHNNTYDWYVSLNSGVTHATIDGNTWFTNHAAYIGGRTLNPLDFVYKQKADSLYEALTNKTNTISSSTTLYPSVKAVQDYTYAKAHIDSAVNNARTQVYYASLTSGNTVTNSALQNVNIVDVSRSSADYYSTGSTSPTGNSFYYNPTAGSILFQDSFTSSGEPVKVQYTTTSVSIGGTSVPILTYATMAAIAYPTPNCFIVVNANEDQDGLRWIFYAPSGTTNKTQLQAMASTLNNF